MDSAAATEELYAVTQDVALGTDLTQDGVLTIVSAHPGTGNYVHAGALPANAVAIRSMSAGELLAAASVGEQTPEDLRSVVIPAATGLPSGLGVGGRADLWLLPKEQPGAKPGDQAKAKPVVSGLIISSVGQKEQSLVGSSQERSVEVMVPADSLPDVLGALAAGGQLVLVPVGAGA
ncbi:hypothetical protein [Actinomyces trachealis]|uniref:hypothetical protein n=1 Tax=Actinomyces trachealis TaxID=2763540 RepID=UPI002E2BEBBC|nr:hypothetical protein [Actinomyces trachealis]